MVRRGSQTRRSKTPKYGTLSAVMHARSLVVLCTLALSRGRWWTEPSSVNCATMLTDGLSRIRCPESDCVMRLSTSAGTLQGAVRANEIANHTTPHHATPQNNINW